MSEIFWCQDCFFKIYLVIMTNPVEAIILKFSVDNFILYSILFSCLIPLKFSNCQVTHDFKAILHSTVLQSFIHKICG